MIYFINEDEQLNCIGVLLFLFFLVVFELIHSLMKRLRMNLLYFSRAQVGDRGCEFEFVDTEEFKIKKVFVFL